jgi:proteic killer suppression protein
LRQRLDIEEPDSPIKLYRFPIYNKYVIRTFRTKETEDIFRQIRSRKFRAVERVAIRKLFQLHAAKSLHDLRSPGNALEALKNDRAGQHSIRVNDQYRVCFVWREGDAYDVEITDYH